tara:strand:+ start:20153 stop:20611 length:459 start_codon:yes stop_codon:yes gene_type:complete
MKVHVRQSTQEDVEYLCDNLRPEDRAEVLASHGTTREALQTGFDESEECWTIIVTDTDEIAGIYGLSEYDETMAIPWLLTTPAIKKVWLPFLRGSRKWVEEANQKYPLLTNAVDADYTVAINWLRFVGFTFIKKHEKWGVGNKPFLEFVRIR